MIFQPITRGSYAKECIGMHVYVFYANYNGNIADTNSNTVTCKSKIIVNPISVFHIRQFSPGKVVEILVILRATS